MQTIYGKKQESIMRFLTRYLDVCQNPRRILLRQYLPGSFVLAKRTPGRAGGRKSL